MLLRSSLWLALLLWQSTQTVLAQDAFDATRLATEIEASRKRWNVPGCAVIIIRGEERLYRKGHGIRDQKQALPVTESTLFPIASCTKAFTGVLTGILVDDGLIDWDDRVSKHLPEFQLSDPAANQLVSIRDLLSHRTGLSGHDLLWYRAPWSQTEMIRRLGKLPLDRPFRTEMQYQSITVMAVGQLLERVSKKSWSELLHEKILDPLEMKSTTVDSTEFERANDHSLGYRLTKEKQIESMKPYRLTEPNASGSIASNLIDLEKWLQLQINQGKYQDRQIISEASIRATHTPESVIKPDADGKKLVPESKHLNYGLGWVVQDYRGELILSHTGLIDGFRCQITLIPEHKIGIAILANLHGTRMNLALSNRLIDLLLKLPKRDWDRYYLDYIQAQEFANDATEARLQRTRKANTRPSLPLAELVGEYEHPAYGDLKITLKDNQLYLQWSTFHLPLNHWHFDRFRVSGEFLDGKFVDFQVKEGKVTAIRTLEIVFARKASPVRE